MLLVLAFGSAFLFVMYLSYIAFWKNPQPAIGAIQIMSAVLAQTPDAATYIWKKRQGQGRELNAPGQFTLPQKQWTFKTYGGKCQNCGRATIFGNPKYSDIVEVNQVAIGIKLIGHCHHWIAWMHGGNNTAANAGWLCINCNKRFSDLLTLNAILILYHSKETIWLPKNQSLQRFFAPGEFEKLKKYKG